jgi:four helix bundle protein
MNTKTEQMKQRTKRFGLRVLELLNHFPNTIGARVVANQIVKSATSVGANYRAACCARSRAQFASKIGIVAEEADERLYWLEVVAEGKIIPQQEVSWLLEEADELTAIFTSARRSASQPQPSKIKPQRSRL